MFSFADRCKGLLSASLTCLAAAAGCGWSVDGASEALGSPSGSDGPPASCVPPFRQLSELPTLQPAEHLTIDVDLSDGVRAPTSGRLALVAVVVDSERENLFELASVPLHSVPGAATLTLPPMPREIVDMESAAGEAALREHEALSRDDRGEARHPLVPAVHIDTYLVVYDDANGNGTMETGQDFSAWHAAERSAQQPGTAGGGSALDRTPNFTGWSSPTDPNNEIIHLTRVHAVFSETGGYHFVPIGDVCRPEELVDPTAGYVTVVGWSLPEA